MIAPRSRERGATVSRRAVACVACALTALVMPCTSPCAAQEAPYDAASLLDHVQPSERGSLAASLGVASLADLPLYDLHVSVDGALGGFGLREIASLTNTERAPWREITLRLFVNATTPAGETPRVRLLSGRCLDEIRCDVVQTSPSVIEIRPASPVAPGARVRVELDLQGTMPEIAEDRLTMMAQSLEGLATLEGGAGATAGDYGLVAHGAQIGSLAAFYPVLARRRGGRWVTDDGGAMGDLSTDAPHHVRARVVVPEDVIVVSSGVEVGVANVADPAASPLRKEVTIHAAAVRELAILLSPRFASRECTVEGTRIRTFFLTRDADAGRHVGEVACEAFRVFSRRFGRYPYTELDVVEAPLVGGAGGVEFSGLVTVALMFYRSALEGGAGMLGALGSLGALGGEGDPAAGGAGLAGLGQMTTSMREFVTAHEVAHQWWHGLVGSDSRAHPWIDESLAQYSAMLYVEERHGAARAREEGERQVAMNYHMMRIQGHADDVVDRPASAFDAPITYAGLVYGKGPFFYRAVRERVGDAAFFAGLARYVSAHRFREAGPDAVIEALAAESGGRGADVRRLAQRWLRERHGDQDLGPSDPSQLLRTMMPPELAGVLDDPAMGPLLRQMMGSMLGGGGLGGLDGEGLGDAAGAPSELEELLGDGSPEPTAPRGRARAERDPAAPRSSGPRSVGPRRPATDDAPPRAPRRLP